MKTTDTSGGIMRRDMPCVGGLRVRQREEGGESRVIEGTAIVFNRPSVPLYEDNDLVIREVIAPEAVTRELLDRSDILATLYHDNTRILARSLDGAGTLSYEITPEGVRFSFEAPDTEDGRTALSLVKRGEISGCSFAFGIDTGDPEAQTRTVATEGGRRVVTYTVRKIEMIRDFTLTPRPCYRDTSVGTRLRALETGADRQDGQQEAARLRALADRADI